MRRRSGSVGSLSYLSLLKITMGEHCSGVLTKFNKPVSVKLKRIRQQRSYGNRKRMIDYARRLRRLRKLAC